jgi:hypothetical protein
MDQAYEAHRRSVLAVEPHLVVLSAVAYFGVALLRRRRRRTRTERGRADNRAETRVRDQPVTRVSVLEALGLHMLYVLGPSLFILLGRGASLAELVGERPVRAALGFWGLARMPAPSVDGACTSAAITGAPAAGGIDWRAFATQLILTAVLMPRLLLAAGRWRGQTGGTASPPRLSLAQLTALVLYRALAFWRWGFLLAWTLPALARRFGGGVAGVMVLLLALLAEDGAEPSAGGEPSAWTVTQWLRRAVPLATFVAAAVGCGTFLAACPAAWAIDQATATIHEHGAVAARVEWRDVAVQFVAAASAVAAILATCGMALSELP